jgi:hypothetical protein
MFLKVQKGYLDFEFVTSEKQYDHSWNIQPSEYEGQGILLQGMALHKSFHLPQESLNPYGRWNSEDAVNRQTAIDAVTAPTIGFIWNLESSSFFQFRTIEIVIISSARISSIAYRTPISLHTRLAKILNYLPY